MRLTLLLVCVLISGCVTIAPPNYGATSTAPVQGSQCQHPPQPTQLPVPIEPELRENDLPSVGGDGAYIRYLEGLASDLATYSKDLRDFIFNERAITKDTLAQHQRDCH